MSLFLSAITIITKKIIVMTIMIISHHRHCGLITTVNYFILIGFILNLIITARITMSPATPQSSTSLSAIFITNISHSPDPSLK